MAESTLLAEQPDTDTEHHDGRPAARTEPAAQAAAQPLVVEDLLVEEVSIDGMCGVY